MAKKERKPEHIEKKGGDEEQPIGHRFSGEDGEDGEERKKDRR
ncbi:hypothetical protein SLEP1_g54975 [Rubroshorea leprosula]|uniref:Uncharacterized protein n=1 Tax=Rubroshorea leprosula TaxID=152421 RepID=A0AAV5ME22_9ROSI|nr:hypothetical protein SLEP1_g54975 [Rubroshorea leprosula]